MNTLRDAIQTSQKTTLMFHISSATMRDIKSRDFSQIAKHYVSKGGKVHCKPTLKILFSTVNHGRMHHIGATVLPQGVELAIIIRQQLHEEFLHGNCRAAVHDLKFRMGRLSIQDNKPKAMYP